MTLKDAELLLHGTGCVRQQGPGFEAGGGEGRVEGGEEEFRQMCITVQAFDT